MSTPVTAQAVFFGWEWMAAMAAFISVMASLILLMISRALNLPQLEQTAKTEMIFAASTVVLVSSVIAIIKIGEPLLLNLGMELYIATFRVSPEVMSHVYVSLLPPNNTLIDLAKLYMEPVVALSKAILRTLYIISIPVEALASIYMEVSMGEPTSGFGMVWIAERIKNTTNMLTFYMFVYYLIVHMLNFIKVYWYFLFTIGIVARSFPLTRGAGAYMMALAVGLYFVLPLAYILIAATVSMYINVEYLEWNEQNGGFVGILPTVPEEGLNTCGWGDYSKISDATMWLDAHAQELNTFWDIITPSILRYLGAVLCFVPLITFIIVISFVLSTTNLFGGMIPEIGRGLVKLI